MDDGWECPRCGAEEAKEAVMPLMTLADLQSGEFSYPCGNCGESLDFDLDVEIDFTPTWLVPADLVPDGDDR